MTAQRRTPLSRERVLQTAIGLADEGGIESVSMRKLGRALGVEAMSLYNHVANKDDLLDGIVDLVMSEFELPSASDPWSASIRRAAISAHQALLRHPWACSLIMSRFRPARVRYIEWILGRLREAGFSAETTYHAYHALDSHILGFTLWELGHSVDSEELRDAAEAFLRQLPVDELPYFVEHVHQHLAGSMQDDEEFEFGLDLILEGLERARGGAPGLIRPERKKPR
jgi:AcrR family transcriptional regulator